MSIRPIDLPMMVQKSADVGKNYTGDNNQTNVTQQAFAQSFEKEVRQMNEQVNQLNKSEQDKVDQNGSGKNKYSSRRGKRNATDKKETDEKRKAASTSLFDVTV